MSILSTLKKAVVNQKPTTSALRGAYVGANSTPVVGNKAVAAAKTATISGSPIVSGATTGGVAGGASYNSTPVVSPLKGAYVGANAQPATVYIGAGKQQAPAEVAQARDTAPMLLGNGQLVNQNQFQVPDTSINVPSNVPTDMFKGSSSFTGVAGGGSNADAFMAGLSGSISNAQNKLQTEQANIQQQKTIAMQPSALEQKDATLRSQFNELMTQMGGRGTRTEELNTQYNLPQQMQQLGEINTQIANLTAKYNAALESNTNRNVLTSNIAGREGQIKRQMAVEVGGLSAIAEALQGNISTAKQIVSDTVNLEFEDRQNQLEMLQYQIELNRDDMTKEEQKQADALDRQLEQQRYDLELQKDEKNKVYELAIAAAQNGAGNDIIQSILGSSNSFEALSKSGGFISKATSESAGTATTGETAISPETAARKMDLVNRIDTLLSADLSNVLGPISSRLPTLSGQSANLEAYINNVKSALTLENLGFLKGAMSDKDLLFITQSASALDNKMTEEAFKAELTRIKDKLNSSLGINSGITSFIDTPEIKSRVTQVIGQMSPAGQRVYNSIINAGVPYSFLESFGSQIGELAQQPGITEQDLVDTVMDGYKQLSSGFNKVGGDTKQASIGTLSEKYESSGNPGAIGYDSTGGWSYGAWQLAHNNAQKFISNSKWSKDFAGLQFNSEAWRKKWKEIASKSPEDFKAAQKDYIYQTHYLPQMQKISKAGLDISNRSKALQDVVWSTAVQHGANTSVIIDAIRKVGANATDAQLINAIYDRRWSGGAEFSGSTPAVKQSVYNRFQNERRQALAMLNNNLA